MNKYPIIDDEKLPNDSDIDKMNREYKAVITPKDIIEKCAIACTAKRHNPHICMLNFDNVARAYMLDRDILTSLNFLIGKARMNNTKCTIKNIIKIKERVSARLMSLYVQGTHHALTYAPNIIDRSTYNALFQEISYMQTTLLARLDDIAGIYQIVSAEHTATLMLYSIKP